MDVFIRRRAAGRPERSQRCPLNPTDSDHATDKYDEYVSDPAKPVPYRERPTLDGSSADSTWDQWLVDDQRFAASRPDVLVYESEPLQEPLPGSRPAVRSPVSLDERQ